MPRPRTGTTVTALTVTWVTSAWITSAVSGCGSDSSSLFGGSLGAPRGGTGTDSASVGFVNDGPPPTSPAEAATCAGTAESAELQKLPVDIIVVLDNSASMRDEMQAVEENINVNFASILEASGLDYRVILLSRHRDDDRNPSDASFDPNTSICVERPLSGLSRCPADQPQLSPRFFHYSTRISSSNSLERIIDTYDQPDTGFGLTPNGWSEWLRLDARKIFLEFTDDESDLSADDFVNGLVDLAPEHFGADPDQPGFVFHSIVGLRGKAPSTAAYLPNEPVETADCSGSGNNVKNAGETYQELSRLTGGLRFPLCEFGAYDVVFRTIAQEVVAGTELACSFEVPAPPAGQVLDLTKVAVSLQTSGRTAAPFGQSRSAADCSARSFYVEDGHITLCPQTCQQLRSIPDATVSVLYTCESTLILR